MAQYLNKGTVNASLTRGLQRAASQHVKPHATILRVVM